MTKKRMWTLIVLCAVVVIGIAIASFRSGGIETPNYLVLKKYGDVELRQYPNMIVAKTSVGDNSFENSGSNGFRVIANYIFGGNDRGQKIAMTSPVVMDLSDTATMFFVMPSEFRKEDLPTPTSGKVAIIEEGTKVLAVIRYGGFSSDQKIKSECDKLGRVLQNAGIETVGSYRYMGYNAPWDVVNRRNEVAVEVVWPSSN